MVYTPLTSTPLYSKRKHTYYSNGDDIVRLEGTSSNGEVGPAENTFLEILLIGDESDKRILGRINGG